MKRYCKLALLAAGAMAITAPLSAVDVLVEEFNNMSQFSVTTGINDFYSDGGTDYFGIFDPIGVTDDFGAGAKPSANAITGNVGNYLCAEDLGADVGATTESIEWTGLSITGLNNLQLTVDIADHYPGADDWDDDALVYFEAQIDGGGYTKIVQWAGVGTGTNLPVSEDTDFNGEGDGTNISGGSLVNFVKSISGTGNTLDLRLTIANLEAGDEDVSIDTLSITGDVAGGATVDTAHTGAGDGATPDGVLGTDEYGTGNSIAYTGGGAGFGGPFGGGTIYMDVDAANLYVGFQPASDMFNEAAILLNTKSGGVSDAGMEDDADPLRRIITRLVETDDDVFTNLSSDPDFAIGISSSGIGQWELVAASGSNSQTFVGSFDSNAWNTGTGTTFREVAIPLSAFGLAPGDTIEWLSGYGNASDGGSSVFLSDECIPAQPFSGGGNLGLGTTSTNNWDNWNEFTLPLGATVTISTAYTSSAAGDELYVEFGTAPNFGGETTPGNWTLNDSSAVTVTGVAAAGSGYTLTLSGAASGDLVIDTVTFDNTVDTAGGGDLYSGIVSLADVRAAVLADGNYDPSLSPSGERMTVRATILENTLDTFGVDNVYAQNGAFGIVLRDASGNDLPGSVAVGDEVLFQGAYGQFNGIGQVAASDGLLSIISNSNSVTPNALDLSLATAADYEAAEGSMVVLSNAEFTNAGGMISNQSGSGEDQTLTAGGTLVSVFFDRDLVFWDGETLPSGTGTITGVLGQFDGGGAPFDEGYQVLPLQLSDLNFGTSVNDWMFLD